MPKYHNYMQGVTVELYNMQSTMFYMNLNIFSLFSKMMKTFILYTCVYNPHESKNACNMLILPPMMTANKLFFVCLQS